MVSIVEIVPEASTVKTKKKKKKKRVKRRVLEDGTPKKKVVLMSMVRLPLQF